MCLFLKVANELNRMSVEHLPGVEDLRVAVLVDGHVLSDVRVGVALEQTDLQVHFLMRLFLFVLYALFLQLGRGKITGLGLEGTWLLGCSSSLESLSSCGQQEGQLMALDSLSFIFLRIFSLFCSFFLFLSLLAFSSSRFFLELSSSSWLLSRMEAVLLMSCLILSFLGLPGPFCLSSSSWLEELMLKVTLLSVTFESATGSLSIEASFSVVSEESDESEPVPIASSSSTTFFSCPLFLSLSQLSTSSDTYLRCETFSHVDSLSGQPCHLTLQSTFFPITFLPMMRSTTQRSYAIWLACMRKYYRPNECYKAFIKHQK